MNDTTPTHRTVIRGSCAVLVVLSLLGGVAWAFWTTSATPGSSGGSAAASVNQAATPSVSVSGREVTINWSGTTLSNGDAVSGYQVQRFAADTLTPQPIGAGCTGTMTATSCTETRVPAGQWVYSVTATAGTSWRGPSSLRSSPVTVTGPGLTLSTTRVRPGTSTTGSVNGFLPGETLRYHLDSPTGTVLTGTLAGSATPTTVPPGGGGAVMVTVPAGTPDGDHTIHAVASPSGDSATAAIVVDGTSPPAPVLTLAPSNPSGDTVSFAFTESEASAAAECSLDGAAFTPCKSPITYAGLAETSHTFRVHAVDTAGNVSADTSHTWTVSLTIPVVTITFPRANGAYNDDGFNAGCGAPARDVCGAAEDDTGVNAVSVSLRQDSTGQYWNGSSFASTTEDFRPATGTIDWSYGTLPSTSLLPEGSYTLRARATDTAGNVDFDVRTFTVDRTTPPAPVLTRVPPDPSGRTASVEFTSTDPTATFECRLDTGTWSACASPKQFTDLSDGSHNVSVRAVDAAGNTSPVTSTTWTVDANPPTGSMTFPTPRALNHAAWTAGCGTPATGDLCGTAGDTGSGVASVEVSIHRAATNSYWNGTDFAASNETWLAASGTASWSYPFAASSFPADGAYTVSWRVLDRAGNATTGGVTVTVDNTAPNAPEIVQAPPDPSGPSVQFDFTRRDPQDSTECRLDSSAWSACNRPVSYSGLADGAHTFEVRAIDAAGNVSAPASRTWRVDSSLPSILIGHPAGGRSFNDTTYAAGCGTPGGDLCGTASDPQGSLARVEVSIRRDGTSMYWTGTGFTSAAEVLLPVNGASSWSYAMAATAFPAEGQYTLRARATDGAGLTATDTVTFTIDRTAPAAPTITAGPTGTTRGDDAFTFSGEPGATFECLVDSGAWQPCTSPRTLNGLADGSHTFQVRATDPAGNTGPATSRTWTVDATAATSTTTFPASGGAYNDATFTAGCVAGTGDLCGTAADAGGSGVAKVEVSLQRSNTGLYLAGTTFGSATQNWLNATGTTSWSYPIAATTFPADDTYQLSVRVTDGVGNTRTTTSTFRIDRTRPTATGFTTTNAIGGTVGKLEAGDTFTLTFSEPVAPGSILGGWTGASTQNVVVRAAGSGNTRDRITIFNATNTAVLPLGTVNLNRTDYVSQATTFGAGGTPSTLTMSGNSVTVTLGTPSRLNLTAAAGPANAVWTPNTATTDVAGNGSTTTPFNETDNDRDY